MNLIVTGSNGFLGRHFVSYLTSLGYSPYTVSSKAYDLRQPAHIEALFKHAGTPDIIFHLAAHVGGIQYNIDHPAELFYDNVMMSTQLIHQAMLAGVKKFVMVGSVCSYPAYPPIPTRECHLWTGYPESSNGAYGIAKLAALEQLKAYKSQYGLNFAYPVLANLYGPGDSGFYSTNSHLIPSLVKQFCANPPRITIKGEGKLTRDFLYVKDAAEALARFLNIDYCEPVNVSGNMEISKFTLIKLLSEITEYTGKTEYDNQFDIGQVRRHYNSDVAKSVLGWRVKTDMESGLRNTVKWYKENFLN